MEAGVAEGQHAVGVEGAALTVPAPMKTSCALAGRKPRARTGQAPEHTEAPPMATTARISRLSNIWKSVPLTTDEAAPKRAPATPAMAAERVKTASLVVVRD